MTVTLSWQGVTYWRQLTFCAVDRAIWLDMTFGKKGLQSRYAVATATRSDQPAAAARDELEQPRRVKHIRRRRDLWAEPG